MGRDVDLIVSFPELFTLHIRAVVALLLWMIPKGLPVQSFNALILLIIMDCLQSVFIFRVS